MSEKSIEKPCREDNLSFFRIFIALFIVFFILVVMLGLLVRVERPREVATPSACTTHLKSLEVAFKIYAYEFDGSLPSVWIWCDALSKYLIPGMLICPGSNAKEDQSSYAMNEFLAGKKLAELSPDFVLLFESMPGWNKAGGREMLTTEHHEGKGCNVLFADWRVEFVKTEQLEELKWGVE